MQIAPTVSPEFLGLARQFRTKMIASDRTACAEVDRVTSRLLTRSRRSPIPRPGSLIDVAREWPVRVPETGRIALEITAERKRLHIMETRISGADFRADHWAVDATEPGIAVLAFEFVVAPRVFTFRVPLLAGISLHALGRWYQRSAKNDDATLLHDLHELALAHPTLATNEIGARFDVPTSGNGHWVGAVMEICSRHADVWRILATRTFFVSA